MTTTNIIITKTYLMELFRAVLYQQSNRIAALHQHISSQIICGIAHVYPAHFQQLITDL